MTFSACGGGDSDSGIKGKVYNANDGSCAWAQETIDVVIDGEKIGSIEPGDNMECSLEAGDHSLVTYYSGTDDILGEEKSFTVAGEGWYVTRGCDDGTRLNDDGSLQRGFGKITDDAPITIDSVMWRCDSVDNSFWSTYSTATMVIDTELFYTGSIQQADVLKVHVGHSTDNVWFTTKIKDGGSASIDTTEKTLLSDSFYNYSTKFSPEGYVLPIGQYRAVVVFSDGSVAKRLFQLPSPGSTTNGEYKYIYSQDYEGVVADDYVAELKRPTVSSAIKNSDNTQLTVKYLINDSRISDGFVWIFDSSKKYLGITKEEKYLSFISSPFTKDGTELTATIAASDISFADGYSDFSSVSYVIVGYLTEKSTENGNNGWHRARTTYVQVL